MNEEQFRQFHRLVQERTGLFHTVDKRPELERILRQRLANHSLDDLGAYLRLISTDGPSAEQEWDSLAAILTTGETYFFRHRAQFELLEQEIIPELLKQNWKSMELRFWSAGCSTGEEAYSLAMSIDRFRSQLLGWNISILATDINRDSMRRGEKGIYTPWSFRMVDDEIKDRYFTSRGGLLALKPDIRSMVSFMYLNLVSDHYPNYALGIHDLDLIICRNVTIYFHPETTARILKRFHHCLKPGGYLIMGHSELTSDRQEFFRPHIYSEAVIYQKIDPATASLVPLPEPSRLLVTSPSAPPSTTPPPLPVMPARAQPSPRPSPGRSAGIDDLLNAAVDALQSGRYDEAAAIYSQALEEDCSNVPALMGLARLLANRGELTRAAELCLKTIEADNLLVEAHHLLATVRAEQGDLEGAKAELRKVVYLDDRFALGHYDLARILHKEGNIIQAKKMCQNALDILATVPENNLIFGAEKVTAGELRQLVNFLLSLC